MSTQRSSSGVRTLRAVFETNEASETRGRSSTGSITGSQSGLSPIPTRKIRSSFVTVEPSGRQLSNGMSKPEAGNEPTSARRESFSVSGEKDQSIVDDMKKAVTEELSSKQDQKANETAVFSAATTPAVDLETNPVATATSDAVSGTNGQSEHPDKPISSIEDHATVSGAVSSATDKSNKKPNGAPDKKHTAQAAKARPSTVNSKANRMSISSTASNNRRTSSIGGPSAPTSRPKPRSPTRPVQLPSYLTAQTASSRAKHQPDETGASKSPPPARRVVKEIPSHLLAPTASSRAKHEEEPAKQTTPTKVREVPAHLLAPTAASKAKHDDSPKPGPTVPSKTHKPRASIASRQSLAPGASRATNTSSRHSLAAQPAASAAQAPKKASAPSGDFLARMTRPTESSISHKADEVKPEEPAAKAQATTKLPTRTKSVASRPAVAPRAAAPKPQKTVESKKKTAVPIPTPAITSSTQPDPAISSEAVAEPTQEPVVEAAEITSEVAVPKEDKPRAEAIAAAVSDASPQEAAEALKEVQEVEKVEPAKPAEPVIETKPSVEIPTTEEPSVPAKQDITSIEPSPAPSVPELPPKEVKSTVDESKEAEPRIEEPKVPEPEAPEPKDPEPKAPEPKAIEPEASEPKAAKSKSKSKSKKAKAAALKAAEAKSDEPKIEEAKVDEPEIKQPKIEEPKTEEPKIDEPKLEQPKLEEPTLEEPKPEKAETEESEDDVTKDIKPQVTEPAVVKPSVEAVKIPEPVVPEAKVEDEEAAIPEEFIPKDVTPAKPLSPVKAKKPAGGLMMASKYADEPSESAQKSSPATPDKAAETTPVESVSSENVTPAGKQDEAATPAAKKEGGAVPPATPAFADEVIH